MKVSPPAAARIALGAVLAAAGFHNASIPSREFQAILEAYYLLPQSLLFPAAVLIPWAELFVGVFLAFGYLTRLSAFLAALLMGSFIWALLWTKMEGIPLTHCGCFGNVLPLTPYETMALDAVMLILMVPVFRYGGDGLSLDVWIGKAKPERR